MGVGVEGGGGWGLQVLRLNHPPAPPSPSALLHLPEFSKYSPSEADSCKGQTDYLSEGWDWQGGAVHSKSFLLDAGLQTPVLGTRPKRWRQRQPSISLITFHQYLESTKAFTAHTKKKMHDLLVKYKAATQLRKTQNSRDAKQLSPC